MAILLICYEVMAPERAVVYMAFHALLCSLNAAGSDSAAPVADVEVPIVMLSILHIAVALRVPSK